VEDRPSELEDKIEIKEKNRRSLSQTTQDLWKEYARTQWLHQKTKPENHGHQRRRRGASKRDTYIFNKIITEHFPKICPFRYRKPPGHQTDLAKIELSHDISSLKQQAQRTEKDYWRLYQRKNRWHIK
jgi:hypothetical protein